MKPLITKTLQTLAALAAMTFVILWMAGVFGRKIEPGVTAARVETAPAGVRTAVVQASVIPVIEEAAGSVQAERKTVVSARIVATIREVRVHAGDQVAAGDPLIRLDDRELNAHVQEAQRAVQAAEAARNRAESDLHRAAPLAETRVISQSEFEQTQSAFKMADAELERAKQALEAAAVALTYATIPAQVTGRVIDRLADPGDTAMPGKPLLSLYDPTALRIEVPVREGLVARLGLGASLQVRLGSGAEVIDGTVDEIVPQAEAGSRTFLVKVGLPKRSGFYTGMFGRVLIPAGERTRIVIPTRAVRQVGQLAFVDVVGTERQLERRLVTLGPAIGDGRMEVLSGIRVGETVLAPDK
ncbi:MAG: efflux RND transporter periplasmic adaptor subunit [Candidatus Binatia bacterium]